MKKQLFLLVVIISMASCEKQKVPPGKAYYNFENADRIRIPNYTEGQVLSYKNENGQQITFTVTNFDFSEKKIYGVGMGFFGPYAAEYFFYDELEIGFRDDSGYTFSTSYRKWPLDVELAKEELFTKHESDLFIQIENFPYWNERDKNYPSLYILVNLSHQKVTLTINGKSYNNVLKIVSKDIFPLSEKRNVNILYYYDGLGIIGFDDLNNNHWRLL